MHKYLLYHLNGVILTFAMLWHIQNNLDGVINWRPLVYQLVSLKSSDLINTCDVIDGRPLRFRSFNKKQKRSLQINWLEIWPSGSSCILICDRQFFIFFVITIFFAFNQIWPEFANTVSHCLTLSAFVF